jgi:hypothetical protein
MVILFKTETVLDHFDKGSQPLLRDFGGEVECLGEKLVR